MPTAPIPAPLPPAPAAGRAASSWEGEILAQLNRLRRYPVASMRRGEQGTPFVRFVLDRRGKVLSAKLERSCGYSLLDREAVALAWRAQPFPPPPSDRTGDSFELIVPIEFTTS